jgi:hypothetical protein
VAVIGGFALLEHLVVDQALDDRADRGPRDAGQARQVGPRERAVVGQGAQDEGAVQAADGAGREETGRGVHGWSHVGRVVSGEPDDTAPVQLGAAPTGLLRSRLE